MATNYRTTTDKKYDDKIEEMLKRLPAYIGSYMEHIHHTTPLTRYGYLTDITIFFEYIIEADIEAGFKDISEITPEYLESVSLEFFNKYLKYLEYYEFNGEKRSNSRVSRRRKLSSLRNLYNYLQISDMIKANNILKVKIPKPHKKDIIRMDNEEASKFISTVEYGEGKLSKKEQEYFDKYSCRDFAMITLMLGTGLRVSELVGLDINDIDLKHFAVKIIRKGGKEDILYYSDEIAENLATYMEIRKNISPYEGSEEALFLSSQRKRISVRSVENLVKKYYERTECLSLKTITPHKLRSTYGTALYEATGDLFLVSQALGHNSTETAKHYIEATDKRKYDNRETVKFRKEDKE